MASIASSGASPISSYDIPRSDPHSDTDDSWAYVEMLSTSNPGSIAGAFLQSSPSGSLASWGIISNPGGGGPPSGPMNQHQSPTLPAPSPLCLEADISPFAAMGPGPGPGAPFDVTSAPMDGGFLNSGLPDSQQFAMSQDFAFSGQQLNDFSPYFSNSFSTDISHQGFEAVDRELQQFESEFSNQQIQASALNAAPWDPTSVKEGEGVNFVFEDFPPQYPASSSSSSPPSPPAPRASTHAVSNMQTFSPLLQQKSVSPKIKQEQPTSKAVPTPIRKVAAGSRVEKKRKTTSLSSSSSSSSSSSLSPDMDASPGRFVIVTPYSVVAHAGKPNPFECFEAMRTTQRGRKGPLAIDTKENALHVRRLGACFCCHSRKVKCDKERPCKHCKKLMLQVPQVVCWQFQDFLTVLFPDFIRSHFKKEEMSRFISDNISGFTVDGIEKPCMVELFSGSRFSATMTIRAKFFTPKTHEVMQHWHLNMGSRGIDLQARSAAPIGLDMERGAARRDEIRKQAREYISAITKEPAFAEEATVLLRRTQLPRTILQIVQNYSRRSGSPIVKRALSIYAMHFVMTRHLCLTRQSIIDLQPTTLVPQNAEWITPRVLNRQIKSVVDELLMREMQVIFENFSKSLKPKSRKEWAPCLAAFLTLCLFMESLETAADHFVISQNEIDTRGRKAPQFRREFALGINGEVENMPFKQFAFQFHQVYQTHSRDSSAKSFNPLVDDSLIGLEDLDEPALEMVLMLRQLLQRPSWDELDFLSMDPILPSGEGHAFQRDIHEDYTGRLASKFLLSFLDETYIFDSRM